MGAHVRVSGNIIYVSLNFSKVFSIHINLLFVLLPAFCLIQFPLSLPSNTVKSEFKKASTSQYRQCLNKENIVMVPIIFNTESSDSCHDRLTARLGILGSATLQR